MDLFGNQFEAQLLTVIREQLPYLKAVAGRIVHSAADADDVVQGALIKAWEKRLTFRNQCPLGGWVARIVVSQSYDLMRRRQREEQCRQCCEPETDDDAQQHQLQILELVIAELPELYREAIHLGVLSSQDTTNAARQLGCTPNTLYQRIHKAKQLIKAGFKKYENL